MCDTFVALSSATADGSVLFGKNSDREPNEAQVLEYHPARSHSDRETVQCTYLEIPQVKETRGLLLSRPFWMWGAEMGVNEHGVVIGNEAVWTKMPLAKKGGLTGMDLLRLALERAASAEEALEIIVQLLSDHGQGGVCGYEDKRMVYHNSFLVADPHEAWVLETAGPLWAALKVKEFYAISNGLTIGEVFDECHPDLIDTARKKGWLKRGERFHFARCFSDWLFTTFSASRTRRKRSFTLVADNKGKMDVSTAIRILRDHEGDGYRPDAHLLASRLCNHAANKLTRHPTQSTGSLIAHLKPGIHTFWTTGTSAPCTSIFKPVWFEGDVIPPIGPPPDGTFNPDTLWWHHERLHRSVLLDYPARSETFVQERDKLESCLIRHSSNTPPAGRWDLTQMAFQKAQEKTETWIQRVQDLAIRHRPKTIYHWFWKKQNKKAGITVR